MRISDWSSDVCSSDLAPLEDRRHAGGPLLDDFTEARLVDPQSGQMAEPGERGEIQLRGATVTSGYFGDEQASAQALTEDGWLRTRVEERRVGKEGVSTGESRGSPYN